MKPNSTIQLDQKNGFIDERSFKELFYGFYSRLCRYTYYILGSKEHAEEIIQDLFTRIWEQRRKLYIEGSIESYLFISARNAAYNYLKSDLHKKQREEVYSLQEEQNEIFDRELFLEKLQQALSFLPEQCREIYCLKNMEGLTYKEIAEYLEISEKTVEVQIYRALKKLRKLMGKDKNRFYQNEE